MGLASIIVMKIKTIMMVIMINIALISIMIIVYSFVLLFFIFSYILMTMRQRECDNDQGNKSFGATSVENFY